MVSALPIGTVTFLFTDVEGSTRLLEELGSDRYSVELGKHREIVRGALAKHGGVEVDTQGDAFFCAFASARSAVACAAEIQDALASGGPVSVRMGIHTGEALVVDRHYVGLDVHRAARIGACGHGGQVVLSPATVALLEPTEFVLRDLGAHRLKDLAAPVVLSQLGDDAHPPLKALFRTNLPVPATPFLGREDELSELVELVTAPSVRVLTLTGPGGTGKTRLSLQLAAELSDAFPDGVWWVPLAPLRDGALVGSALANVLEVDEEPGIELVDSIANALARKRMLVLLDNCEHVVESAARLVAGISAGCQDLVVLATSREALAVSGEHVFSVPPLVDSDAVELFRARARAAGASLDPGDANAVIKQLCARLDNLPLAVELAAARAAALPPAALLERLSTSLDVLKGPRDADERQRTLRATIEWSVDLLEESELRLFRRLGVFVGGATLTAIETVCEADLAEILSLAAKSLVRQASGDGEPRYFMLETIREFAAEQLEASGELARVRERHVEWFAGVARVVRAGIEEPESGEHILRLERDLANFRTALTWSEQAGRTSDALILGNALLSRDFMRGHYSDAEDGLRRALALNPDPLESMDLHTLLGAVLRLRGRPQEALETLRTYEQTLESLPQRSAKWWDSWIDVKIRQGALLYFTNHQDELAAVIDELAAPVEEHGTSWQRFELLELRGQHAFRQERYVLSEQTEALVREIHRHAVELDDLSAEFTLGFCLLWRGKLDEADTYFARGREHARSRGSALMETRCLVYGVVARRLMNDVEGARAWQDELDRQDELHGYVGLTSANAAWLAWRDGDLDLARCRAEEALADWQSDGAIGSSVFVWTARFPLLGVALERGDVTEAVEHARSMLDPSQQPLPDEIAAVVARAASSGLSSDLAAAVDAARPLGYA